MSRAMKRNWKRTIELWRASGLSKTDFCCQNNISNRKFSYYSLKYGAFSQSREAEKEAKKKEEKSFAEVVCKVSRRKPAPPKKPLILRLACGASIELAANFDAEILRRVLRIAREL